MGLYYRRTPPLSVVTFTGTLDGADPGNSISETVTIVPIVDQYSVNSIIANNAGVIQMDFESFQHCEPLDEDTSCTPSGDGWNPGWAVQSGPQREYLFRINVTNFGEKNILLDEHTAIFLLRVQEAGGGNDPKDLYILKDPTDSPEDEDGELYNPNFSKGLLLEQTVILYFGADQVGVENIERISVGGLYSVNLILFGYMDENDNGVYDVGVDIKPYSQNIPFQGLYASST